MDQGDARRSSPGDDEKREWIMPNQLKKLGGKLALALMFTGCQGAPFVSDFIRDTNAAPHDSSLTSAQKSDVQVALGQSLEQRGDLEGAAKAYELALQSDPKCSAACVRLAMLYDRQAKFAESAKYYQRALSIQPKNAEILCNQGYSLALQQRWAEAATTLRLAIEINPDHQRAHNNLGLVLARMNEVEAALVEFRRAGCSESNAHTNLAYALSLNGDTDKSCEHYAKALQLQPDSVAARNGMANVKLLMAKKAAATAPAITTVSARVDAANAAAPPAAPKQRESAFVPLPSVSSTTSR